MRPGARPRAVRPPGAWLRAARPAGAGKATAGRGAAPTRCRLRSRAGESVATGKGGGHRCSRLPGPAGRNGWAGSPGRLRGRSVPESGRGAGAQASGSAERTRIRPARGWARVWRLALRAGTGVRARAGARPGDGAGPEAGGRGWGGGLWFCGSFVPEARGPGPEPRVGDANGWAGWSPSDSWAEALSWRASGGDLAARRNHPAGVRRRARDCRRRLALRHQAEGRAGRQAGRRALGGWALASGWRGPGTIRPGGTDQEGMRFSRSSQRNKPVRCRSSSRESSGEAPISRFPLDWLLSVSTTDPSPGTHFRQIPRCADPHTFSSKRDSPRLDVTD